MGICMKLELKRFLFWHIIEAVSALICDVLAAHVPRYRQELEAAGQGIPS